MFLGAVSGLAFGAAEAVSYSQLYAQAAPVYEDASDTITIAVWRLVSGSVFHASMSGITGFFIGLAAWHRSKAGALMMFGLTFAAVLHGLYNNFSSGWIGALIATITVAAFLGYTHTGEQIGADLAASATPPGAPGTPEQGRHAINGNA